jgi:hypothetical protein
MKFKPKQESKWEEPKDGKEKQNRAEGKKKTFHIDWILSKFFSREAKNDKVVEEGATRGTRALVY